MSTTHSTNWLERKSVSTWHVARFVWKCWDAFQESRERQKLRATLSSLSDRELMDIGTARGEIDYVASHRGTDPRDIRSGDTCQRLTAKFGPPTSDRGSLTEQ
ncbi:DUF1127 domain-containing protein [Bradyrhizobium acaciae]|uniref:DUF1127 domain-containing protein n=1 Tax=Bradyrhizobium acaciae TaxID=2683706 RepID=UPI0030843B1E|nr:DUF1127 domain-containing protein [Bradyrhizobium acaciae]